MSIGSKRRGARWAVPAVIAALAVGGTGLLSKVTASADESLPPRTAAQLLVDLQTARLDAGSGTIVQKADLGLPQLPSVGGAGSSDLTSLVSGHHTLRAWYAGPSKVRLALMGTLGESDVIRNGNDLWIWSSESNSASHRRLASSGNDTSPTLNELGAAATGGALTPQQAADRALAELDPSTVVTTDGHARIAGRSAYELVLKPKDTSSLVGRIGIAVDAVEHVPLRVQVFAKDASTAAIDVAFTQISFARPADSQFRFVPPPGVKVTEETTEGPAGPPAEKRAGTATADEDAPRISGTGWTSVAQAQLPVTTADLTQPGDDEAAAQLAAVLGALPRVSGSWGSGRLLSADLFSALITDSGRVLVGAVTPQRLYELAGEPLPPPGVAR